MEENFALKCIRKSQEYAFVIVDSFQYEAIYIFPKNSVIVYKPHGKVTEQVIIDYGHSKCAMEAINLSYTLIVVLPSISDHIIKKTLEETLQVVRPLLSEMSIVQEEYSTPKGTERSVRPKKILRPDVFERLNELLEGFLTAAVYKIYPYFLYDDEEFTYSAINTLSLCLPIGIGGLAFFLPLPVQLSFQLEMTSHVLYHESTVTVHEILNLDSPSTVIEEFILIYKGYIISGQLPHWELNEVLRMYNTYGLYLKNSTSEQECFIEKVTKNDTNKVITMVVTMGLTVVIVAVMLNNGENHYDPWMVDKAKRLASELQAAGLIAKIDFELKKLKFSVEKLNPDYAKQQEILNNMKKSRSLDSSPIGSPRHFQSKEKIPQPLYIPYQNIYIFHYALIDLRSQLVTSPQILASPTWIMEIMRPLLSHYSKLYEKIQTSNCIEVSVDFSEVLPCEKVAAVKYENFVLYAMYRGPIEKLKQFGYELISVNLDF